jgi:aspartyl-tRNA(Asn)/glutamyl-tRNA(Gln) amidotransferase subunit C
MRTQASQWRWRRDRYALRTKHYALAIPRIAPVIDREQVLHVARLARLRLDDADVEKMSRELSTILDHIEKINELDLENVEPTSHVIHVENVLREDVPRPSWPREQMLAQAPDATEAGFRVPSPGA